MAKKHKRDLATEYARAKRKFKPGQGGRFKALKHMLAKRKGVYDAGALAAGRKH